MVVTDNYLRGVLNVVESDPVSRRQMGRASFEILFRSFFPRISAEEAHVFRSVLARELPKLAHYV